MVLVGCKKDLRHDVATIDFLRRQNQQPVATAQVSPNFMFTVTTHFLARLDVARALAFLFRSQLLTFPCTDAKSA